MAGLWTQRVAQPNPHIVLWVLDKEVEHPSLSLRQRCQRCNWVSVEWDKWSQGDCSWQPKKIREIPQLRNLNPKVSEIVPRNHSNPQNTTKTQRRIPRHLKMPFSSVSEFHFQNFRIHYLGRKKRIGMAMFRRTLARTIPDNLRAPHM